MNAQTAAREIWSRLGDASLARCLPPAWIEEQVQQAIDEAVKEELRGRDNLWCVALVKSQERPEDLKYVERVTRIFNESRPDKSLTGEP